MSVQSPTQVTISKDSAQCADRRDPHHRRVDHAHDHLLLPGKYSPGNSNIPDFNGDYIYFASGVYYFEDVGYVPIGGNGAWGGAISNEQFVSPGGNCNAR